MAEFNPLNQQSRKVGTGFTNLNRILQANKSNTLGQTIGQNIQSQSQQVRQDLQTEADKFREQANKARIGSEADVAKRDEVLGRFNTQSGFQGVQEPEIEQFQKFQSGKYAGPLGIEDKTSQELQNRSQQLSGLGKATLTQGGQQELLRRFAGGRGYTQGQQLLDTTLLGKTGQQPLSQARKSTMGVGQDISRQMGAAGQIGQQYQTEAQRFGQDTRNRVGEMLSTQEQELTANQAQKAKQAEERFKAVSEGLRNETLTDEQLTELGLTDQQVQQFKLFQDISGKQYATKANITGQRYSAIGNGKQLWDQEAKDYIQHQGAIEAQKSLGNKDSYINSLMSMGVSQADANNAYEQEISRIIGLDRRYANQNNTVGGWRDVSGGVDINEDMARYFEKNQFDPNADYSQLFNKLGLRGGKISGFEMANKPDFEFERYLQQYDPASITRETAATSDQLAKANALRQLSGESPLYNQSLAGTAQTSSKINQDVFKDAVDQLLGSGDVKYNAEGQIVPVTDRGKKVVSQLAEYGTRLGTGVITPELYDQVAKNLGLPEFDEYTGAVGDLYGTLRDDPILGWATQIKPAEMVAKFTAENVGNFAKGIGGKFKKLCFDLRTPIELTNGDVIQIENLKPGMEVLFGGKVISNNIHISSEMVMYKNTYVSPSHAVYENNEWIRVGESKKVNTRYLNISHPVCQVITENNLLFIDNTIWADYEEIPGSTEIGLSDEVNLYLMNANKKRNKELSDYLNNMEK